MKHRRHRDVPLSPGEALELQRRRADATGEEVAAMLGVAVTRYRQWEHDERSDGPRVRVGRIDDAEWCWLMRRRSGITMRDLAASLELSCAWLNRAEHGQIRPGGFSALVAHWDQRAALDDLLRLGEIL